MYIGPGKRRSSLVREVDARRKAETGDGERGRKDGEWEKYGSWISAAVIKAT